MGCIFIKTIVGGRKVINKNILHIGAKLDSLYNKIFGDANKYLISMVWIIKNKTNLIGLRSYKAATQYELMDLYNATNILLNVAKNIDYYIYREARECLILLEFEFNRQNMTIKNSIIQT